MEEALTNPVYDDENLTEDDKIAISKAREDVKAGRVYSLNGIKRQLGEVSCRMTACPKERSISFKGLSYCNTLSTS